MSDDLHFTGKTVNITGYSFKISDELREAFDEMLDAANTADPDRIRAAIDKYETLNAQEIPRIED